MRSYVDINPEAMSKATLLYLKERPVNSESQSSQSNPRSPKSAGAVAEGQKDQDTTARHRSNSDMPLPSSMDSAKPNVNNSSQRQSLNGSAEAHGFGIHTPPHSPLPEHPVHDESVMAVVGSSKEHITGNKVTALWAPQHFRRQKN